MTDMTTAWDAWSSYHRSNGFHVESFLNPPADPEAMRELETRIGFALPDDLRALWSIADGQVDVFGIDDPSPGTIVSPLFGSHHLFSVEAAGAAYEQARLIAAEYPEFDEGVTVRDGDPVHAASWRPGWLPFAEDGGGNSYAVDLSPAEGGTYGQVIVIGRDEDERRVLAPGIADWLAETAERSPVINDDAEPPIAYFDMVDD